VEDERPIRRFLAILQTLLLQRKAVLVPKGTFLENVDRNFQVLGWFDNKHLYLLPDASFAAASHFCRDCGGTFPISQERLFRELNEESLSECNPGRRDAVEATLGEEIVLDVLTVLVNGR
jgi:hypothetical protein